MKIAVFLQDLAGGGAERVAVLLMNGLVQSHELHLVLARREGPYLADLDSKIAIEDFGGCSTMASVGRLARWLRRERPDIVMSHLTHVNVAVALANLLAGKPSRHVAVEHNQMGLNFHRISRMSVRIAYRAARLVYPGIDRIVNVSNGVAASVKDFTGLSGRNFETIANPVVTPALLAQAAEAPAHPWLVNKILPTLLGCGRLVEQKDFSTLIDAFALMRRDRPLRLIILGEGDRRAELEQKIAALGLQNDVELPGFDRNPFAAMRAADAFVLSSQWEGLPTVLIEALATGVNVVSTDCPSGPDEVLQGGRLGPLVPVGDAEALAAAIGQTLANPKPAELLRARAMDFSLERAVENYIGLFGRLGSGPIKSLARTVIG